MKIGILSRHPHCYSTHRLVEAAKKRGHEVEVVDYLRCYMNIAAHNPHVVYAGKKLHYDAVIPRIAARHTFYGTAVVRQFEMMHLFSANESQAITRSKDKLRCLQLLSRKGIGLPITGCAHSTKDIDGVIKIVGGAPLVIKLLEGTQGIGVVLAETQKASESVISAFRELDAHILVQEFIKEYAGQDIRALVIGGKVIAAMKRISTTGDFRSNIHRGGKAEKVTLTAEEKSIAIRATKALGLNIAGVDLMRSHHGPVILEVNSSPGLHGIEKCTGKDVAKAMVEFVEKKASPGKTKDVINPKGIPLG